MTVQASKSTSTSTARATATGTGTGTSTDRQKHKQKQRRRQCNWIHFFSPFLRHHFLRNSLPLPNCLSPLTWRREVAALLILATSSQCTFPFFTSIPPSYSINSRDPPMQIFCDINIMKMPINPPLQWLFKRSSASAVKTFYRRRYNGANGVMNPRLIIWWHYLLSGKGCVMC